MAKKSKKAAKPESKFDAFEQSLSDALKIKKDGNPGKHADISEAVTVLENIVSEIVADTKKFDGDKMNKTAGTRVRKYLMLVKNNATAIRKAVQNKKGDS